jgi:hypothetical protein
VPKFELVINLNRTVGGARTAAASQMQGLAKFQRLLGWVVVDSSGNGGGYKMPDESVSDPHYWLDRARVARIKSDQARNPRTKRMLSGIAEAYERLAERNEQRLRDAKNPK